MYTCIFRISEMDRQYLCSMLFYLEVATDLPMTVLQGENTPNYSTVHDVHIFYINLIDLA